MTPEPETIAFQHAHLVWEEFHAKSTELKLGERLCDAEITPVPEISEALRVLPEKERVPVAFGVFLKGSHRWSACERSLFLGEFLPTPPEIVSRALDAASRGLSELPEKLPVTLEEFPSRIWRRAIASGNPERIAKAGPQAVLAMLRLFFQNEDHGEPAKPELSELQPGEEMEFLIPSGDLPPIMDLLGLPPFTLPELKGRVLDWIMDEVRLDRFRLSDGQDAAFYAWIFSDTEEGSKHADRIIAKAAAIRGNLLEKRSLYSSHHAQFLGRLLFRLGLRGESMRCAKAVGISPWQQGWQFQPIVGSAHIRIRDLLLRPGVAADVWKTDPALACSAMSIPLWLVEPVSRVPELMDLFNQGSCCPWIFPRLHHIYQWHLALCGKQEALGEIAAAAPDWTIGLAESNHLGADPFGI